MERIDPQKLDRILSEIEIPTLPSIATAIMERTLDEKTSARQLSDMVEKDQALAAKVLKVANSPFYRRIQEISTIRSAVVLLGLNVLKSIVLSISVINMFNDKRKHALDLYQFWQHSIACAVCARTIANKSFPAMAEDAFAAGLLHDLGKVVFDQALCAKGEYQEVLDILDRGGMDIIRADQDVIGLDHAALGKRLMERWNLPSVLSLAVAQHHYAPAGPLKESEGKRLCAIIHVADLITNHLGLGIYKMATGFIEPSILKQLDLTSQDIQELSLSLKDNISAISGELGIPKAEPKTYFEVLQSANAQLGKLSLDLEQKKMALERRAVELSGLNQMSTQLQSAIKLSEITSVVTTNALTIMGSKKVRCMIRLNNLRIIYAGETRPLNAQERALALPLPYQQASDLTYKQLHSALVKSGQLPESFEFAGLRRVGAEVLEAGQPRDLVEAGQFGHAKQHVLDRGLVAHQLLLGWGIRPPRVRP